jgi:hypothetical protein
MFRFTRVIVAVVFAIVGQSAMAVDIWLSGIGSPGNAFPLTASAVPTLEPYLGGSGTIYIWGRPDTDESLENVSLNLVSDTSGVIQFTSATVFNEPWPIGMPTMTRFEFVDDSTEDPPLPISANRVNGITGLRVFDDGPYPAVGIGNIADPLYSPTNTSWLIAAVDYDALASGENAETHLFLEIGAIGMNHIGQLTDECYVVFGDATDGALNAEIQRGVPSVNFDARIRPRPLPGDADRNGAVEPADYDLWQGRFGQTTQLTADHNGNTIVDAADYVVWRKYLGASASSSGANAVPEPSTAISMLIAFLAFLRIRGTDFSPSVSRPRT